LSDGEWTNRGPPDENHANCLTCAQQRDAEYGAVTQSMIKFAFLRKLICFGLQIGDVKRMSVEDRTSCRKPTRQGALRSDGNWPVMSDNAPMVAYDLKNSPIIGITEPGCTRRDLCEHALQISRGAREDAQDFAGGGLLLSRLG
jgi:hypothetical protein